MENRATSRERQLSDNIIFFSKRNFDTGFQITPWNIPHETWRKVAQKSKLWCESENLSQSEWWVYLECELQENLSYIKWKSVLFRKVSHWILSIHFGFLNRRLNSLQSFWSTLYIKKILARRSCVEYVNEQSAIEEGKSRTVKLYWSPKGFQVPGIKSASFSRSNWDPKINPKAPRGIA